MYLLNKTAILTNYNIRGVYLTKNKIKWKKQILIYLRSPKHFNIGKHKILSFKTIKTYYYLLNYSINYKFFYKKNNLYKIYNIFHKLNILYRINSVRITIKTKILWIRW